MVHKIANDNVRSAKTVAVTQERPCPICGKPARHDTRPFCSKRCADVDLHRWLGGVYRVPAEDADESGSEQRPEPEDDR